MRSFRNPFCVKIITEYTKEAGVRQLERILAKLMRKTIQILVARSSREKGNGL